MQIHPHPQGFGATVADFDVQSGGSPEEIAALRLAYDEHNLLVFRNCGPIAPERQATIAGWFGPIGANSDAQGRPWTMLHNDEASGSRELPFHSDISFMEFPLEGISLHPLELPRESTSTTYVSNAVAWVNVPPAMQDELRGRTARHYYASSEEMDFDWPVFEYWHPLCLEHPRTGRPLLFVTEHHVDRISAIAEDRAAAILEQLFAVLYAPERRYEHVWQEGDLVIWDNLAVQHARTRASEPSEGARCLRRVAMGKHGFPEQLERVRLAARAMEG